MGTKRHVLVDARGVPLSLVVTGAYRLLSNLIAERTAQNLCADKGYQSAEAEEIMRKYRYVPHIRSRGEEKARMKAGCKPRRWIVEVAHSWFNRFRKLLVRYEKTTASYEALLQMAATVIIYRKLGVIYG